jgi:pimeloyl-ACP methyl ester carboxylesterase
MQLVEYGNGQPLVLIPGIQGRWEYMRPAIDALARSFRVITFPLCGEPASRRAFDPMRGLDNFADQVLAALNACRTPRAAICGVSFGGLIALRFAARHPDRTSALILVSTPGPGFRLRRRHALYARLPRLFGPVFLAEVPRRLRKEVTLAIPNRRVRIGFAWRQIGTFLRAPLSMTRMAARARLLSAAHVAADCARVSAPTLVVTGEPWLDHVVSVEGSSEFARLIAGARAVRLTRSGHIGYITRPDDFAAAVTTFVQSTAGERDARGA